MYSTSTLEDAVIVTIKSENNRTEKIEFEPFGADRKALVHCQIEGTEYKFRLKPEEEKVHVNLEMLGGHIPRVRDIPPRKLSQKVDPIDLPMAMTKIIEGEA